MTVTKEQQGQINQLLDTHVTEFERIDNLLFGERIGVSQAIGDMRRALIELDGYISERKFETAAALGYWDISSAFIFLQRTLGGVQSAEMEVITLIQTVAEQTLRIRAQ